MKIITFYTLLLFTGSLLSLNAQEVAKTSVESTVDKDKISTYLPKISGFLNLRYQYSTETNNYTTGRNGFDVRRAYLNLNGSVTKNISYKIQADLAGTPKILDAFAEWKPFSFIGIQAGQFKIPLTLENPYSPSTLETADNSQVVSALVTDIAGNKNNGRDIGLLLNGNLLPHKGFNLIEYKLAVLNGNVINTVDNNKLKDLLGVLYINPIKPLTLSGSYYSGNFGPEATKYKRNRYAVGVVYDNNKLLVRSEYVAGTTASTNVQGFYVSTAYYATKELQAVLKYDFYQSDIAIANSAVTNYVAGLNYWFTPKSRLQLNYAHVQYKDITKTNTDYVVAQLLVSF